MESTWSWEHFSFEFTVQFLVILISAGIGWLVWKMQFKETKVDETEKKKEADDKRLQTLLRQCILSASDNKNFLDDALRFQSYGGSPYEIKGWIAGLQNALKYDAITNLLNSGLDEKLPENTLEIMIDARLSILALLRDLAASEKLFDFYSTHQTFESNARCEWDKLRRTFDDCLNHMNDLKNRFQKTEGRIEVVQESAKKEVLNGH